MSSLDYSPDAENVLNFFYRCDVLLYVEGDDDVPFWKVVFDELSDASVEVLPMYGASEVDKKIKEILDSDLKVLAARDSDFIRASGQNVQDPRILYTHGYSIENCLYNVESVVEISFVWCREMRATQADCERWFEDVFQAVEQLVLYDCANHVYKRGVSVVPDNCTRFMVSEKSTDFDLQKLQSHVAKVGKLFSEEELAAAAKKIAESNVSTRNLIRGHFLESLVQKYVSKNAGASSAKKSVSFDALYASAVGSLKSSIKHRPETEFYQQAVNEAVGALADA